ncbi:MAG: response regulator [Phenylobacterium sp.]|uniref:response regulator n=1 Tax=Phenylobacterium sp. TaxID=1871053 RepID=UPI0025EDE656|nr:response regulator [Phenylobacterium sp.]MCG9916369.1 response regulator [Phenylobacterium sp.]
MFNDDRKMIDRMAPALQRVLIIDPSSAGSRMLADLMRSLTHCQVWVAPSAGRAMEVIKGVDPQIIFIEHADRGGVDGIEFTRRLRRSEASCRQAPVIMILTQPTSASVIGARDAGVHEFLRKPFTTGDLLKRLAAVALKPRDWVEAVSYVGPDRRRFNSGDYQGTLRRRSDARATPERGRIVQAVKILKSAAGALESDPVQALRAMKAQGADLQSVAVKTGNMKLAAAAADFHRYLGTVVDPRRLDPAQVAYHVAALATFAPEDTAQKRVA